MQSLVMVSTERDLFSVDSFHLTSEEVFPDFGVSQISDLPYVVHLHAYSRSAQDTTLMQGGFGEFCVSHQPQQLHGVSFRSTQSSNFLSDVVRRNP